EGGEGGEGGEAGAAGGDTSTGGEGGASASSGASGSGGDAGTGGPVGESGQAGAAGGACAAPRIACGGDCVDLAHDPEHCGTCGNACSAELVCSRGECSDICLDATRCDQVCADLASDPEHCGNCETACDADQACVDGECAETQEVVPRCETTLPLPLDTAYGFPTDAPPVCLLLNDGSGKMFVNLPTCGDGTWAACDFASSVNLSAFDVENGRAGVLEIEFCLDAPMSGELNLWYGAFPARKRLSLIRANETLRDGCHTVRRAPEEALCHYDLWPGDCGSFAGCCQVAFQAAKLTLIAERCQTPFGSAAGATLKSVRFLPKDCVCASEAQCEKAPGRPRCDVSFTSVLCDDYDTDICGVCAPPAATCPGQGEPCSMKWSERECPGTITCNGAASSCEVDDAECLSDRT
ncbi:MAG TPA: hypothetical protein VGK73_27200, partial [Polyangiaceae bacterium]